MGFKHARYLVFLGAGLALSAAAPEFDIGMKMGAGFTSSPAAQHSNLSLQAGLTGAWKVSEKSSVIGEITYRYFRADDWEKPLPSITYNPDGTTYAPTAANSFDSRQDPLEGLGLSLGYRTAMGNTGWSWQAGVNVHVLKSTDQAIGDVRYGATSTLREGFSYVRSTTSISPGAFLGVHTFLNQDVFLEMNAVSVGYTQITYVPFAYTGKPAHTETATRNKLVLEVSMGFRF